MILSLRKKHRIIWIILAILLPLLFVAAIMVIPEKVEQEPLYQEPVQESLGYISPKELQVVKTLNHEC